MYDKVFLTGCDKNTEWMLNWWIIEYLKHNNIPIVFADFGISKNMLSSVKHAFDHIITLKPHKSKAWFLKPESMLRASKLAKKVCWIDTDCHVLDNISDVFDHTEPNKLTMVEDKPWSERRGSKWHNSGVVAFEGSPPILKHWMDTIRMHPEEGDQEVLHMMMEDDPLRRYTYIKDLPNEYNWLRIQIKDGIDNPKKKIMHWTGYVGKKHIEELIENG
jgi:hypothetical protein|tara:strand:- start:38 stop:691 length:654 start_codon:yes stop_codon:yes gene_type:complete